MNYNGQNLKYKLFRGQDLSGSTFVGADLTGANMRDCNIDGCDFTDAIMHFSNIKGSTGIADFTNARVSWCPKGPEWNDFVGADFDTQPPLPTGAADMILEIVEQTPGMTTDDFTNEDTILLRIWEPGDGLSQGSLTGSYPDTDRGRNLYNSLPDIDLGGTLPMEEVLNEAMRTNLSYDKVTNEFYPTV